jgi:hypothetical protein
METNDLLKTLSTLTDESLKWKGDTKTCLFCGLSHWGHCLRSIRSEVPGWDHLSGTGKRFETVTLKGVEVQTISRTGPEWHWSPCSLTSCQGVEGEDEHDNIQTREVVTRWLESGYLDNVRVINVEKFGKRTRTSNQINSVFYMKFENINMSSTATVARCWNLSRNQVGLRPRVDPVLWIKKSTGMTFIFTGVRLLGSRWTFKGLRQP